MNFFFSSLLPPPSSLLVPLPYVWSNQGTNSWTWFLCCVSNCFIVMYYKAFSFILLTCHIAVNSFFSGFSCQNQLTSLDASTRVLFFLFYLDLVQLTSEATYFHNITELLADTSKHTNSIWQRVWNVSWNNKPFINWAATFQAYFCPHRCWKHNVPHVCSFEFVWIISLVFVVIKHRW